MSSHRDQALYTTKETPEIYFTVTGLEPKDETKIKVRVSDDLDREIVKREFRVLADLQGMDEVIWRDPPKGKLGFYRVKAELADGSLLKHPWSTTFPGEMTYAIVHDLEERELVDTSILQFRGQDNPLLVGRTVYRGYRKNAASAQWRHLEQHRPGEYAQNPKSVDIPLGTEFTIINGMNEGWSQADRERVFKMKGWKGGWVPPFTPEGEKVYYEFAKKLAENYRKQHADFQPRLYEVTMEMLPADDGTRTWKDIVRFYEISYKAIHEGDPDGICCGMGVGRWGWEWKDAVKAGVGQYLDAVTEHSYYVWPPEKGQLVQTLRASREEVIRATGKDLPVYCTEFGYATHGIPALEGEQMRHIVRCSLIFAGEGYKALSSFFPCDYRGEAGYGYTYNLDLGHPRNHKGDNDWVALKRSPKPVFPAYSAFAYYICNTRPVGDIPFLGETVWGYVFKKVKTGRLMLALWDWGGTNPTLDLPVLTGAGEVIVADHMGNERTVKTNAKGEIRLTLADVPQYVLGVSPDVWEAKGGRRDQMAAEFAKKALTEKRAKGGRVVSVMPAAGTGKRAAVAVTLEDYTGKGGEAEVTVRVCGYPEGRAAGRVTVPANGQATAVLTLPAAFSPNPLMEDEVVAEATLACGKKVSATTKTNFLYADYRSDIAIDGKADDWTGIAAYPFDLARQRVNPEQFLGPDDMREPTIRCAWNEKGLVFLCEWLDDEYMMPPSGRQVWNGDAVQFGLTAVYRYQKTTNQYLDAMKEKRIEMAFGMTKDGPSIFRHESFNRDLFPDGPIACDENYQVVNTVTKEGDFCRIRYEVQILWCALDMKCPGSGAQFGFACTLNDRDTGKGMNSGVGAFDIHRPFTFGSLILRKP